ncbi:MAG: hypothetical protein BGO12_15520 [Verrucomicrobia bacterium 61-8]|nr:MAG: hypothetical protein BGO12_15520 [Verrucomicrobia bacterium 61-8]
MQKSPQFAVALFPIASTAFAEDGGGYRIVLQIRNTADVKPQNVRIEYHTEVCGECNRAEYACVCSGDGHGH